MIWQGLSPQPVSLLCRVAPGRGKSILGSATLSLCKCLKSDECSFQLQKKKMVVRTPELHFLNPDSQPAVCTKYTGHSKCGFSFTWTWARFSLALVSPVYIIKKLTGSLLCFFLAWTIHKLQFLPQWRLAVIKGAHTTDSLLWIQHQGFLTKSPSFLILLHNCQKLT